MSARKLAELVPKEEVPKRIGTFVGIVVLGFLLWPLLSGPYTSAFQASANAVVGSLTFGKGGHALFLPMPEQERADTGRDASWDAPVELSIEGIEKKHVVSVNPRRLAYVPWLCFAALVVAAPLRRPGKASCLAIGSAILAPIAFVSLWIIVAWLFARVPGLVYDLDGWQKTLLNLSYEAFVTPLGNKFVLPVLLAAGLVLWQLARESGRAEPSEARNRANQTVGRARAPARKPARPRRQRS